MKYKSLLIVTYGRSGSTLLQGLLNTIDGVLVRGENNGFLYDLYCSYRKLKEAEKHHEHGDLPNRAWYGIAGFNSDDYLTCMRDFLKQSLIGDVHGVKCYGFKEIRFLQKDCVEIKSVGLDANGMTYQLANSHLDHYLSFLRRLLPECAVIVNTRNHEEVVKSAWWQDMDEAQVRKQLQTFEAEALDYVQTNEHACHIDFADVCQQNSNLWSLFEFLGVKAERKKILEVLAVPHSYAHNPSTLKRTMRE